MNYLKRREGTFEKSISDISSGTGCSRFAIHYSYQ